MLARGQANDAIKYFKKHFTIYAPAGSSPALYDISVPFDQDIIPRAYAAKGDLDKAIAEYKKLLTFDPASKDRRLKNPRYEYRLAKLLEKEGKPAEALEHYGDIPAILERRRARSPRAHRREGASRGARLLPGLKIQLIINLDFRELSEGVRDRGGRGDRLRSGFLAGDELDFPFRHRESLREESDELLVGLPLVRRGRHFNTKLPGCVPAEELVSRGCGLNSDAEPDPPFIAILDFLHLSRGWSGSS